MKKAILCASLLWVAVSSFGQSSIQDDLKARFMGRSGQASEDARSDDKQLGIKVGCHGNTFLSNVTITSVNVSTSGNVANVTAGYDGNYTRQGWVIPCVQSGHEDHHVYGTISVSIKQIAFKAPEITWNGVHDVGEIGDPTHDSNRFAAAAAKSALEGAMQ